ncbi:hypothetical protein Pint_01166 [Pistacia integerrima]|uniref:Uncharacterized protein n=1 Tax=Pistacia integerrima TaxID=434235 RepID=A0ACC0ZKK3_9ROSI|nr:hypothetical protein Pint_01166 [Pistacia integerrima]
MILNLFFQGEVSPQ